MLSLGDAPARVAPAGVVLLWFGARHSRRVLRGLYGLLAGFYVAITLSVAVWPWVPDPSGWIISAAIVGVGALVFWSAGRRVWWHGYAIYAGAAFPLLIAFIVALFIANPFEAGWSRHGL